MTNGNCIRIGFIGAGENTRVKHIPGFQKQDEVELVGVVNRSRNSSQRVADEFNIPKIYDQWEDLIADDAINAICIGTWPYLHCPITVAALEAGKHVLCEARMAMNAAEAHQMLAASQAHSNLIAQLVPSPFMLGPDAAIYDTIESGCLGDILSVNMEFRSRKFIDPHAPLNWRQDGRVSGLNAMAMGILYETTMRWVGNATRVIANSRIQVPSRQDEDGKPHTPTIPDHLEILCDFENGASGHFRFSQTTGLGPENAGWIFGSEGTLKIDFGAKRVWLGKRGDTDLTDITPPADTWKGWRVEEEFIGAIRGQEAVQFTTFSAGVNYMEFTEAVALSNQSGCAVTLPL